MSACNDKEIQLLKSMFYIACSEKTVRLFLISSRLSTMALALHCSDGACSRLEVKLLCLFGADQ